MDVRNTIQGLTTKINSNDKQFHNSRTLKHTTYSSDLVTSDYMDFINGEEKIIL
jgi:hypothetical protein